MKNYTSKKLGDTIYQYAFNEVRIDSFGSAPHVAAQWMTGSNVYFGWIPVTLWDDLKIVTNERNEVVS